MPPDLPLNPDLDHLRKQAKQLLRAARAGERDALERVRDVPRLAGLDDPSLAAAVQLADAQHAIAREYRHESWPALKHAIEAAAPIERQAEMLLASVRNDDVALGRRLLALRPELARFNVCTACCAGDADAIAALIGRDPALATMPHAPSGWAPLLYLCAAKLGEGGEAATRRVRGATLLLDAGADPNSAMFLEGEGRRDPIAALYFACVANHVGVVRLLLERGANPNDGESVYHAAELNHRECLEALLEHGARLGAKHEHWNNTPLFFLAGYRDHNARTATARAGMRWLLKHGADPNVPSYDARETPLHLWARNDTAITAIDLLLEHGADPNLPRADGRTPYILAVRGGHEAIAARLRERGARVDALTPLDALIGACMRGDRADALALRAAHAVAFDPRSEEVRDLVAQAAIEDRAGALRLLAEFGCDVAQGRHGSTPLHEAAWHGRPAAVAVLLELGAPIDVRDRSYSATPLGWALHGSTNCRTDDESYAAVVNALIDAGATAEGAIENANNPPPDLASPGVMATLRARGLVK